MNFLQEGALLLGSLLLFSCSSSFIKFNPPPRQKSLNQTAIKDSVDITEHVASNNIELLERLAKLGDPHACFKLGDIYLNGENVIKDVNKAKLWFEKSANNGLPIAMWQLGNMYRDGLAGAPPSLTIAISWYEKAAAAGNIKALLSLGEIYRGWYGIAPNYDKAMGFYIKAAGFGSLEAEYQMARLITNNLVDKKKYAVNINTIMTSLQQAANTGNLDAMVGLGDYYMQKPNLKLALEYYNKAAQQHFAPALLRLGLLYFSGEGVLQNYKLAMEFFMQAAQLGSTVSEYHLGEIYRQGLGVETDPEAASKWYAKAANKDFPKAVVRLGDLYFSGKGVEPNLYKAIELYKKSAILGDSYSGLLLSIFYAQGLGVEQDLPSSVHWYNIVEKNKDQLVAKFDIARAFETGFGFSKSYIEAAKWYLLAAQQGLAKAQSKLADLYVSGLGVPKDYNLAIKWYKNAAEQGYYYAQYSLALLLPKVDSYRPSLAYSLMKKAALSGYKPAQYNLGLMYLQGRGVKSNAIKAYSWLNMAVSEGVESNKDFMSMLINDLDPEARNKAVLLAERYRNRYKIEESIISSVKK